MDQWTSGPSQPLIDQPSSTMDKPTMQLRASQMMDNDGPPIFQSLVDGLFFPRAAMSAVSPEKGWQGSRINLHNLPCNPQVSNSYGSELDDSPIYTHVSVFCIIVDHHPSTDSLLFGAMSTCTCMQKIT